MLILWVLMFIPKGTMVAGPEGRTPFMGSLIASGINNIGMKKNYVSDPATNGGYVFPRQTETIGQALNNPMAISAGDLCTIKHAFTDCRREIWF